MFKGHPAHCGTASIAIPSLPVIITDVGKMIGNSVSNRGARSGFRFALRHHCQCSANQWIFSACALWQLTAGGITPWPRGAFSEYLQGSP